ncbi:hypothetical protein RFI_30415 [Reticulomyxa filosa]|uniref:Uncharacterized protein n=1 Tax=Reticulomyxa filosa TaxID=46433 RepID=X6M0P8_RETFI|nr:hypothetical protein RFI_30415 [Reticulomyxa filosa]|eukprot:ETO06977.1 hypothetical protein RFI_30415 [Reticulomyxa filosa]
MSKSGFPIVDKSALIDAPLGSAAFARIFGDFGRGRERSRVGPGKGYRGRGMAMRRDNRMGHGNYPYSSYQHHQYQQQHSQYPVPPPPHPSSSSSSSSPHSYQYPHPRQYQYNNSSGVSMTPYGRGRKPFRGRQYHTNNRWRYDRNEWKRGGREGSGGGGGRDHSRGETRQKNTYPEREGKFNDRRSHDTKSDKVEGRQNARSKDAHKDDDTRSRSRSNKSDDIESTISDYVFEREKKDEKHQNQHNKRKNSIDRRDKSIDRLLTMSPRFDGSESSDSMFLPTTPGRFQCDIFPFNRREATSEYDSEYWRGGNDEWYYHKRDNESEMVYGQGGDEADETEVWKLEGGAVGQNVNDANIASSPGNDDPVNEKNFEEEFNQMELIQSICKNLRGTCNEITGECHCYDDKPKDQVLEENEDNFEI